MRREDLLRKSASDLHNNVRLCADHFEPQEFVNPIQKKKLKATALPTIFSIPNPPPPTAPQRKPPRKRLFSNMDILEPPPCLSPAGVKRVMSASGVTPTKERLVRAKKMIKMLQKKLDARNLRIKRLEKQEEKLGKVEKIIEATRAFLGPQEHELFSLHMKMSLGKRQRYSDSFKAFAISVYYKSPTCYRFLRTRLKLPSKSAITLWLSKLKFREGLCKNLLNALKIRVGRLRPEDKICSLIFDEISLKKSLEYDPAQDKVFGIQEIKEGARIYSTGALVFLVAGMKIRWKQAVSYFFVKNAMPAEKLLELLKKVLEELKSVGLTVKTVVSDQGSNFSALLSLLQVSREKPFFYHDTEKIYVLADTPHLLKSTRNCLLKNSVKSSKGTAKWEHIKTFYEKDKKLRSRLCPRLKDAHFRMEAFGAKMRVKLAAQVLSRSVAAGINNYVYFGALEKEAEETANFVEHVNNLFDSFNSSARKGQTRFQCALTTDSQLLSFLDESDKWLATWKVINREGRDVTKKFRFIDGWRLNISCVKMLLLDLTQNFGFVFLLTRRLCTDSIENLFSVLRGKGGFDQNPSCLGFSRAFKQSIVT